MKNNIKDNLNSLQLSDVYALMFWLLYQVQDVPEYATVSEMCYLLDGSNMMRLLTYFAGKTIKIPEADELVILVDALLMYNYINVNGESFANAQSKLKNLTTKQKEKVTDLYLKILPLISKYNINRSNINKYDR